MPQIDPAPTAQVSIDALQDAIDSMNGLKTAPGADLVAFEAKIKLLQDQQDALGLKELKAVLDSPANRQAIAQLQAATDSLNAEAKTITEVATALDKAAKVITAAATVITKLAPFFA